MEVRLSPLCPFEFVQYLFKPTPFPLSPMPVSMRPWVITAAWELTALIQSCPLQCVRPTPPGSPSPDFSSACCFSAQKPSLTPRVCYHISTAHLPDHISYTYTPLPSILCSDSVLQPPRLPAAPQKMQSSVLYVCLVITVCLKIQLHQVSSLGNVP